MLIRRGFKYRIYPTTEQVARLGQWENALRFLWNVALEQHLMAHDRRCKVDRRYPTAFDQGLELTELRKELPWLNDVPRHLCVSVLDALEKAWRRCFERTARVPRFKKKGRDTVMFSEFGGALFRLEAEDRAGTLTFPKLGKLRTVAHRPLVGTPKSCTLTRDGDQWFASILCEFEVPDPVPSTKPPVAIDRGVALLLADSNRRTVENPRALERLQPRIARAQRVVARRVKGSKNQQKARARVARLQRKARRQREHVLHVESAHYAKNHGAVIVEKLLVKNMTRSAKGTVEEPGVNVAQKAGLNRALLDTGMGRFVTMLRYKVETQGARVIEVPAAYSSQTCSACGVVDAQSRREQDVFLCTACGHLDNADLNAAQVLLVRGMHALAAEAAGKVCGGDSEGRPVKQKRAVARRRTRSQENPSSTQ